jgi:hypothetical protein
LPGICSGGGGGGVCCSAVGECFVLLLLFVWEEGTTGAGMAAGGPILAPGIKQEDLHHHALEQLPGLAYCINDNPPWGKQTHHTYIHLSLSSPSCSVLCHSWSYFTLILKLDNGLVCLALWLITRGT